MPCDLIDPLAWKAATYVADSDGEEEEREFDDEKGNSLFDWVFAEQHIAWDQTARFPFFNDMGIDFYAEKPSVVLSQMNDEGKTFAEIAIWIEENL